MLKLISLFFLIAFASSQAGQQYSIKIFLNDKNSGTGVLTANSILTPGETFDKGIYFKMSSGVTGDLAKIMEKEVLYYYLPYRHFLTDFHYKNPFFGNKYIQGTCKLANGSVFTVRLEFDYFYFSSVINDTEGENLKVSLNSNVTKKVGQIAEIKKSAINSATVFFENKLTFDSMEKSGFSLQEKIAKLRQELADANENKKQQLTVLEEVRGKIDITNRKLSDHKRIEVDLKNSIADSGSELDKENELLSTLNGLKEEAYINLELFNNELLIAQDDFLYRIDQLTKEAPSSVAAIEAAKGTLLNQNDLEATKDNIRRVYP